MSSTFSNLKFELIGNGEQSGTWGTTTNSNIGTAIDMTTNVVFPEVFRLTAAEASTLLTTPASSNETP